MKVERRLKKYSLQVTTAVRRLHTHTTQMIPSHKHHTLSELPFRCVRVSPLLCEQTYIYMHRWHLQVWLTALPMLADSRLTIYIAGGELRGWSWLWRNQLVYRFLSGSIYYCFPFTVNEWIFLIYVQTYQILIMLSFPILPIQCFNTGRQDDRKSILLQPFPNVLRGDQA